MLSQRVNKTIIILLICTLLSVGLLAAVVTYKPSIHTTTLEQIQSIDGIGEVLSSRIVIYLDTYPNADIDDLTDVKGIGEGKLKLIKRKYGD